MFNDQKINILNNWTKIFNLFDPETKVTVFNSDNEELLIISTKIKDIKAMDIYKIVNYEQVIHTIAPVNDDEIHIHVKRIAENENPMLPKIPETNDKSKNKAIYITWLEILNYFTNIDDRMKPNEKTNYTLTLKYSNGDDPKMNNAFDLTLSDISRYAHNGIMIKQLKPTAEGMQIIIQ